MVDTDAIEFDKKEQVEKIIPWVLDSEKLYAVFDLKGAGTGFVAITNKRLIFYDKAPMRKRKALTSVPFSKITAVSSIDAGGFLTKSTSELTVRVVSEEYEFEFWGAEKAQRAYSLIMKELLEGEV